MWEIVLIVVVVLVAMALVVIGYLIGIVDATYRIELENTYHDCDDYLMFDEGNPDHTFVCKKCKKRY